MVTVDSWRWSGDGCVDHRFGGGGGGNVRCDRDSEFVAMGVVAEVVR